MDRDVFLAHVDRYRAEGWRLALINATALLPDDATPAGAYELTWSFARDRELEHLRERVVPGESVPSIGRSFPAAFLYENELRELFGIDVTGITVDLAGQMYRTAERVPFSPAAIRARLEAAGRLDADGRLAGKPAHKSPAAAAATGAAGHDGRGPAGGPA